MKLSEVKGKKGLEFLGEIIEPSVKILSDNRVYGNLFGGSLIHAIKWIAKEHTDDAINLWCICNNKKTCNVDALTMAKDLVEILTDDDLMTFFAMQSQMKQKTSSGSATGSTQGTDG